jgi:hypothetical protein
MAKGRAVAIVLEAEIDGSDAKARRTAGIGGAGAYCSRCGRWAQQQGDRHQGRCLCGDGRHMAQSLCGEPDGWSL